MAKERKCDLIQTDSNMMTANSNQSHRGKEKERGEVKMDEMMISRNSEV